MALTPINQVDAPLGTSADPLPAAGDGTHVDAPDLRLFVFALFFILGGITSLNDVLIPKLKELFTLSNFQAMLVQSAFFGAYFLISLPGAALVKRVGYMRGATIGLLTMMTGCLLFIPASSSATFGVFLFALFVLASGVVIVQVVANPLISLLGPARSTHSRLTFAQAFNSLGTTVFPYFGSILILGGLASVTAAELSGPALGAYRESESRAIVTGYLGIAAALAVVALVVWLRRDRLPVERHEPGSLLAGFDLLRRTRFGFGAACIFVYVGAEVAIGSLIVNYLEQASVLGLSQEAAGKLIPLYWGGALAGRFVGSALLRVVSPGKLLANRGGRIDRADPGVGECHGFGVGHFAARDRANERHYVPHHLLAGVRGARRPGRRRVGDHLRGDRGRSGDPAAHRPAGGRHRQPGRVAGASGRLLRHHRGLRHLCTPSRLECPRLNQGGRNLSGSS